MRDGAGNYSLPSPQSPIVFGSVSSSPNMNTILADIAAALTASLCKDGQTPATGNLNMAGFGFQNLGPCSIVNAWPINQGGTGAITAAAARVNLGITATGADTTYAYRANNLSDLANAATARTNLGLTSMGVATGASTIVQRDASGFIYGTQFNQNNGQENTAVSSVFVENAAMDGFLRKSPLPNFRTQLGVSQTGADTTYAYRANNLSDLASAAAARVNIGLAAMDTAASASTIAQRDGAGVLSSTRYYQSSVAENPAVGNVFVENAAADGFLRKISVANFKTALNLPTAGTDTAYAWRANNLSDLANAATARANLGLATVAASASAADLTAGVLADARVQQSNVTQYQAALAIAWGQITGTKNADQLQGQTRSAANAANTVVSRDGNSYIFAQYFNQASAAENPTIGTVFVESNAADGYHRKISLNNFMLQIFASAALTGTPSAPTAAIGTQSPQIATTNFVDPAHSLGGAGYQKLSSGLIFQWGNAFVNTNNSQAVVFPLAFPNNCFAVLPGAGSTSTGNKFMAASVAAGSIGLAGFTMNNNGGDSGTQFWFAIGN